MRFNRTLRGAASAVALLAGAHSAQAALTVTEAFDGGYFQEATGGQGILVDYIPTQPGQGVLFLAMFTFDDSGDEYWGATSFPIEESEFDVSGDFFQFAGGTFGSTPGSANLDQVDIGTINVNFRSCNLIDVSFTPNSEGTGLGLSSFDLDGMIPLSGSRSAVDCPYQQEFSGCPSFAAEVDTLDRACLLPAGTYSEDITLSNDTSWILGGGVFIGDGTSETTITIEPGTYLYGAAEGAFLAINRNADINAIGQPAAPIVLTSATDLPGGTPVPGDFAGLVVAGNAPANCNPNCQDEALGIPYGGDDPTDSSGIIRYLQVRYAGFTVRQDNELNAVTLLGVGNGTEIDYIQAYRGSDDGIEFFGGTVNVRHAVVSGAQDDSYDTSFGYNGKTQYLFVQQAIDSADHVIEADNAESNFDLEPRSLPVISDATFIQPDNGDETLRIRRGTGFILNNLVMVFPGGACVDIDDDSTFSNAGSVGSPTGNLAIINSFAQCGQTYFTEDSDGFDIAAFFADGIAEGDAQLGPLGIPSSGSPLLDVGGRLSDDFFNNSDAIGAFENEFDGWHLGWTFDVFTSLVQ